MSYLELHLTPLVGEHLASLGWSADHPYLRAAVPPSARGTNVVLSAPPTPAYAGPVLGGVVARLQDAPGPSGLLLTPAAAQDAWGATVERLTRGGALATVVVSASPASLARAERGLLANAPQLLVMTIETAADLQRRSVLHPDRLSAVVLANPESWEHPDLLVDLMQDLPREAQRIVITGDPSATEPLIERYAWRAIRVAPTPALAPPTTDLPVDPEEPRAIRTAGTPWHSRVEAVGRILDLKDPDRVVVWTADRGPVEGLEAQLTLRGVPGAVVAGDTPVPDGPLVIAYDLPDPARLASWRRSEVILLAPPGTDGYLQRLTTRAMPLRLPGAMDTARTEAAARRSRIAAALGAPLDEDLLAIAPLLERWDASAVAAAIHRLWRTADATSPSPPSPPDRGRAEAGGEGGGGGGGGGRLWVGVGRRDGATPADLVGLLIREAGVERDAIGKIELRESFSLVELRTGDPGRVAETVTGRTIRRRRVIARLDQGAGGRPPSRGGRGGKRRD